jgi:hypothetical protein
MSAPGVFIVSLDPSSTCTGYAVMETAHPVPRMIEAGRFRGKSKSSPEARVLAMRGDLLALLEEARPQVVLVEMPLEKQHSRTEGKRSGMAVWAGAAWAIWMAAYDWAEARNLEEDGIPGRRVVPVSNTEWTRGMSKQARRALVLATYPNIDLTADTGGDTSDAIAMLLRWAGAITRKDEA